MSSAACWQRLPGWSSRRRWGRAIVGGYVVVVAALFVFFWPLYTAQVIPYDHWHMRMWFPSWV